MVRGEYSAEWSLNRARVSSSLGGVLGVVLKSSKL